MKNLNMILTIAFFTFTCFFSAQASWQYRSAYKPVPGTDIERSVLYFTLGGVTKTYTPSKLPFGLVESTKYVTNRGEFYLTSWSKGAQSNLFRVFDMSEKVAEPICEITSFSEVSKLKFKNGVLYLLKTDSPNQVKPTWQVCAKISK